MCALFSNVLIVCALALIFKKINLMIFQYFNIKTIWKHPNYLKALKKEEVHFNIFMIQIHFKKHFDKFIKQDLYSSDCS